MRTDSQAVLDIFINIYVWILYTNFVYLNYIMYIMYIIYMSSITEYNKFKTHNTLNN